MQDVLIKVAPTVTQAQPSIIIGKQGEENVRRVVFDVADLIAEFGDGEATVMHLRPDDEYAAPVYTTTEGTMVYWGITYTDTANSGTGRAELRWKTYDGRVKSTTYRTTIIESPTMEEGTAPDVGLSWVDAAIEAKTSAQKSAVAAADSATSAEKSATRAGEQAADAADSADEAEKSAGRAATSESNAADSAADAKASENNAESSAAAAAGSATDAATSETNAATSAGNAATSEKNASNSASAASTSEKNAKSSASNASSSASTATTQANTATSKAAEAATSEANAKASAEAAASSQTAAATSATNAAESERVSAEYLEQVKTITTGAQGYYTDEAALKKAVPVGEDGWWAVNGETDSIWVWDSDTSAWVDSHDMTELGDYYTRTQVDTKIEQVTSVRYTITVPADGWMTDAASTVDEVDGDSVLYYNTVDVDGITADTELDCIRLAPAYMDNDDAVTAFQTWSYLNTAANYVYFYSATKPTATFAITAIVVK